MQIKVVELSPRHIRVDRINAFGSVTGRVGVAFQSALIYAKGGYAWANNKFNVDTGGATVFSQSAMHSGWTVGGGVEWMFAPAWSAKAEYMYADYSKQRYANLVDVGASVHTVKVGVNYHFGWGGPSAY